MNDWLDYKGSGSARAYSRDYMDSVIAHSLRDNIDKTVGTVMDKLTGGKRRESEYKQRDAENRLKQSQMHLERKKIRDAALKLRDDARDNYDEFYEYRTKYHHMTPYIGNRDASKDPKAAAQIDSAIRNMTSDLKRMIEKINRKDASLRTELDRVKGMYNDFVHNYAAIYIEDVPDILKQAEKYLSSVKLTSDDLF